MKAFIGVLLFSSLILATFGCTHNYRIKNAQGVYQRTICYNSNALTTTEAKAACENANKTLVTNLGDPRYGNYLDVYRAANYYNAPVGSRSLVLTGSPRCTYFEVFAPQDSVFLTALPCNTPAASHCEFIDPTSECEFVLGKNCIMNRQYTLPQARDFCTNRNWSLNEGYANDGFSEWDSRYQVPMFLQRFLRTRCQYFIGDRTYQAIDCDDTTKGSFACKLP